jgi:hypothetical protein
MIDVEVPNTGSLQQVSDDVSVYNISEMTLTSSFVIDMESQCLNCLKTCFQNKPLEELASPSLLMTAVVNV